MKALAACLSLVWGGVLLAAPPTPLAAADSTAGTRQVIEPVLGVQVAWDALEEAGFDLHCDAERRDMRVLARVPAGNNELVFIQSLVAIRPDIEPEPPPQSFEEDSGQLVKLIGGRALQLGVSSGLPSSDFPEIRSVLMRELMRDYVRRLERIFPDKEDLRARISSGMRCEERDPKAQAALVERGLATLCGSGEGASSMDPMPVPKR